MKILVVNWQDITNPLAGGAEVHFQEIFSRIARRGHHVTLCCCSYPGAPPEEEIGGIHIVRRGGRPLFNFRFPLAYLVELRRTPFDVVIEDLNKVPFFTPLYVRRPLVGLAHHLFGATVFRETGILPAVYVYWMERLALLLYRHRLPFIVVSASTAREFVEKGFPANRVVIVHNCVDHERYTVGDGRKSRTPLAGCFGRLKRYKSVDHFLRALPVAMVRFPELKGVVAGEGDDLQRLQRLARDLGIAHAVEFTGRLTEDQKVELLRRLWFTVSPSSKEGWGLTVVEANACGTPSVAADVPGLRDAIKDGETGLLYPYGDIGALTSRMVLLVEQEELRSRLSTNAVAWARTFDWDYAADATLAFLQEVIRQRGAAQG